MKPMPATPTLTVFMVRISLFRHAPRGSFIDTPFQRGGRGRELVKNRFQRFIARKTAEAVATTRRLGSTPLKRGVNQSMAAKGFRRAQKTEMRTSATFRKERKFSWLCCSCWWTERAGRGIIAAWRSNQPMKRGVRRERDHLPTGGRHDSKSSKC